MCFFSNEQTRQLTDYTNLLIINFELLLRKRKKMHMQLVKMFNVAMYSKMANKDKKITLLLKPSQYESVKESENEL